MDENNLDQLRRLLHNALGSWGRALRLCMIALTVGLLAVSWKYAEHEWNDRPPPPLVCASGADGQAHCQYVPSPR